MVMSKICCLRLNCSNAIWYFLITNKKFLSRLYTRHRIAPPLLIRIDFIEKKLTWSADENIVIVFSKTTFTPWIQWTLMHPFWLANLLFKSYNAIGCTSMLEIALNVVINAYFFSQSLIIHHARNILNKCLYYQWRYATLQTICLFAVAWIASFSVLVCYDDDHQLVRDSNYRKHPF